MKKSLILKGCALLCIAAFSFKNESVSAWVTTPERSKLLQVQPNLPFAADVGTNATTRKFDWIVNADGKISFRGNNGLFISSKNGANAITCTNTSTSGWEAFSLN